MKKVAMAIALILVSAVHVGAFQYVPKAGETLGQLLGAFPIGEDAFRKANPGFTQLIAGKPVEIPLVPSNELLNAQREIQSLRGVVARGGRAISKLSRRVDQYKKLAHALQVRLNKIQPLAGSAVWHKSMFWTLLLCSLAVLVLMGLLVFVLLASNTRIRRMQGALHKRIQTAEKRTQERVAHYQAEIRRIQSASTGAVERRSAAVIPARPTRR